MAKFQPFIHRVLALVGLAEPQHFFDAELAKRMQKALAEGLSSIFEAVDSAEMRGNDSLDIEGAKRWVLNELQRFLKAFYIDGQVHVLAEHAHNSSMFHVHGSEGMPVRLVHSNLEKALKAALADFVCSNQPRAAFYQKRPMTDFQVSAVDISVFVQAEFERRLFYSLVSAVIDALSDIERLKKRILLKKRLVLSTEYCVTLDRVPNFLFKAILSNAKQIDSWRALYFGSDASVVMEESFLMDNPFMVLDTQFFDSDFKTRLVASFDALDSECDGLIIHSENAAALRVLSARFKGEIEMVYIDPPYNTGLDTFAYQDSYHHSSWRGLMRERLCEAEHLMGSNGVLFASINDNESQQLEALLKEVWGVEKYQAKIAIKVRHEDRILRKDIAYQEVLEDVHMVAQSDSFVPGRRPPKKDPLEQYLYEVQIVAKAPRAVIQCPPYERIEIYAQEDYILTKHEAGSKVYLKEYNIRGSLITQKGSASAFYEQHLRQRRGIDGDGALYKVIGMGIRGDGLGHRYIRQPFRALGRNGFYYQGYVERDHSLPMPNFYDLSTAWSRCSHEGGVPFRGGKKPQQLFQILEQLGNIGSDGILLDFFAGSGSAGQSVIEYNRRHHSTRKYILIERADYFDSVLKTRLKKVIYSSDWKSKRIPRNTGISQIFKVLRLESTEDVLNHLNDAELAVKPSHGWSYPMEPHSEVERPLFLDPWSHGFEASDRNKNQKRCIDLVESFNLLLGLRVQQLSLKERICVEGEGISRAIQHVRGWRPDAEGSPQQVLIVWRQCELDSEQDHAVFQAWLERQPFKLTDFHHIWMNGPHGFKNECISAIEDAFFELMWGEGE